MLGHAICEGAYIDSSLILKLNDWPLIENSFSQKLIDLLNMAAMISNVDSV